MSTVRHVTTYRVYRVYPEGAYEERRKTHSLGRALWWVWLGGMRELAGMFRGKMPRRMCRLTAQYKVTRDVRRCSDIGHDRPVDDGVSP